MDNTIFLILGVILISLTITIFPHLLQLRLNFIEPIFFRKVKIKKLSFLFTAMDIGFPWEKENRKIVSEVGIIIPMMIIQLLGYLLSILLIITLIVFSTISLNLFLLLYISIAILVTEIVIDFVLLLILWQISQKKKNIK